MGLEQELLDRLTSKMPPLTPRNIAGMALGRVLIVGAGGYMLKRKIDKIKEQNQGAPIRPGQLLFPALSFLWGTSSFGAPLQTFGSAVGTVAQREVTNAATERMTPEVQRRFNELYDTRNNHQPLSQSIGSRPEDY